MLEFAIKVNIKVEEKPTTTTTTTSTTTSTTTVPTTTTTTSTTSTTTTLEPTTTTTTSTTTSTTTAPTTTSTTTSTTTNPTTTTSTTTSTTTRPTTTTSTTTSTTTQIPSGSVLTLEDFGGQAYYKRFDGGLTYTNLGNNTTQITYTGSDIDFTNDDLGKSFCGLFANLNPQTFNFSRVDEYYPGLLGSRYSKVIQVIDSKNIIVDFGYNQPLTNGKGYVFFDNSQAWDRLFNAVALPTNQATKIRIKEYNSPLDVYVVPQFDTKNLPTHKPLEISTGTNKHGRIKIGYEDYFQWEQGIFAGQRPRGTRTLKQAIAIFNPGISNHNFVSHNVYWLPPHRTYSETQTKVSHLFGGGGTGAQARIVAVVNNLALQEQRELIAANKLTVEIFRAYGNGFMYAGGTYTTGSGINDDVNGYFYYLIKNFEHQANGCSDFKSNLGGGFYHVAEDVHTNYIPEDKYQPTYLIDQGKVTASYDDLDPALKTKTFFPEHTVEITGTGSWYRVCNDYWINSWANAANCVQVGRFVFWVPKLNWWKVAYNLWYNRGQGTASFSAIGPDVYNGKKVMIHHIPRSGSIYTVGRHYTTTGSFDGVTGRPNARIASFAPNQIRNSINWSLVLQKPATQVDPVKDVPANCHPMDMQPGDQFRVVGYGDTVYTVTTTDRGLHPNFRDEVYWWNPWDRINVPGFGYNSGERLWPYNFATITLDKNLPANLPATFEITMVTSNAERLLDGRPRPLAAIYKSNAFLTPFTTASKFADPNILASNPFGHLSYNHGEITMWAKNYQHNGYYRMSSNSNTIPTSYTIIDPNTKQPVNVGPLKKYSKGYTFISCSGFQGEFGPQAQFYTRDIIRQSQSIFLPEAQKEKVRMYGCTNMNGVGQPYVEVYPTTASAPDMPKPCRDLLNSLPQ